MISQHAEWLNLVEISGPFLAVPVLENTFPQGLDAIDRSKRKYVRDVYEYRCDAIDENHLQANELNRGWIRIVLKEILDFDESVLLPLENCGSPDFVYKSPDGNGTFAPDLVLKSDTSEKPFLFVSILPPDTDMEKVKPGDNWPVSIVERMTLLCRSAAVRLGLVTDGERWMLVNAPVDSTSGQASWYSRIWFQETVTFQAFKSLFEIRRWFGPDDETLPAMLEKSLEHHEEVTDTLGEQVKRAVEVLVQSLDKADQDRHGNLLKNVKGSELYEAGLTVMMRLVFVLCAEERGLLLLGDPTYDRHYAMTTLRGQLAEEAGQHGPEMLERRHDAWARLLSVFRAVYGGIEHETLRMAALGGSLFDPDRYPFLEGRAKGTCWQDTPAQPLPIDNRTVLLLLNALQVLEQRSGALLLSYKALDVEQIGHVYEGLLEHTVQRLPSDTLGLVGSKKAKNPNVILAELESAYLDGIEEAVALIKDITLRGLPAIEKALKNEVDEETFSKVLAVCGGDSELAYRIRPFSNLLRTDAWGEIIVYRANSFAVTLGADRRETGTHYTPKSLTESIVETTLEPVVYVGPAEGKAREEWQLKSSAELLELKICDPAMGSGAFLVQVCRWLSERVVEAWGKEAALGKFITVDGLSLNEAESAEPMPDSLDEQLLIARRLIAEKCLYGVDLNPLAVELAKLSIWLITLAKGRPFGFLDHNLRPGDSLLGLHNLEQLTKFSLHPEKKKPISIFASNIEKSVRDALDLRKKLRETPIRDIRDVQYMERLDQEAKQKLEHIEHIADAMIGEVLASGGNERTLEMSLDNLSTWAAACIQGDDKTGSKIIAKARKSLSIGQPASKAARRPFHWMLEFPEVMECNGFNGIIGNPPFVGGSRISTALSSEYLKYLQSNYFSRGRADLSCYFYQRGHQLGIDGGTIGLISTNTIAQADSRRASLEYLIEGGCTLYCATTSYKWPGVAAVFVSLVHFYNGDYVGKCVVDGKSVKHITSFLDEGEMENQPHKLHAQTNISFHGSVLVGKGFILEPNEAKKLNESSEENSKVLFQYINGKDINSTPDQSPSRWVINFFNWPLNKNEAPKNYSGPVAEDYPEILNIVMQRVKPRRDELSQKKDSSAKGYGRLWWQYGRRQEALYSKIKGMDRVLVRPRVSNTHAPVFLNTDLVFSDAVVILVTDQYWHWAVLQSSLHEKWARKYCSTLKKDLRYSATDAFENFPLPEESDELASVGIKAYCFRQNFLLESGEGLTSIYNRYNDSSDMSEPIKQLREMHIELDTKAAAAYGWNDMDLGHSFHETKQGFCFTISEESRREVLQRLLKLNHVRYEEEVKQGLHDKKKNIASTPRKKKTSPAKGHNQMSLFEGKK